jgi:hypothetical protein
MGYSLPQVFRGRVPQTAQVSRYPRITMENRASGMEFPNQNLDMTKMMLTINGARGWWVFQPR